MSRKQILKYLLLGILMLPCLTGTPIIAAKPPPLNEHRAMAVLFANLEVELPPGQGCVPAGTVTVGGFIRTTLSYLAMEKKRGGLSRVDSVRIELTDDSKKDLGEFYSKAAGFPASLRKTLDAMKNGCALYQYTVWWTHAKDENVWSRGIQFLVREPDGSPVKGSFRCLSTP